MKEIKKYVPKVGMRTLKTSLAALVCLIIYYLMGRSGTTLPILAAIICMQDSMEKSLVKGRERLMGTVAGAVFGMLLLLLIEQVPSQIFGFIIISLGIMLLIAVLNHLNQSSLIVMSCVVFLTIVLKQNDEAPWLYSLRCLFDSSVGIGVALLINRLIKNPAGQNLSEEEPGGNEER